MAVNPALTDPKLLAQAKRTERRRRTRRIRQGVAAGTVTLFVAFFSTIYAQMATGHDPALAPAKTTTSAVQSETETSETSPSPAPVTTQQS
jgi:Na+/H+ antiporter NhaD/arsenite permease-like protein